MSKVEELAKKYCEGSSFEDACMEKSAYIAGYHQAEKDLKSAIAAEMENLLKPVKQRLERDKNDPWDSDIAVYKFSKQLIKNIDILEVKEIKEEPYITKKVGSYTTTTKIIKKGEKV